MEIPKGGRAGRVAKRAVRTLGRAQKTFQKAEATRTVAEDSKVTSAQGRELAAAKADQLYRRAGRQETRARKKMDKAQYIQRKKATPKPGTVGRLKKSALEAKEEGASNSKMGKSVGRMAPSAAAGTVGRLKKTTKVSSRVPVKTLTRTTKPMTKRK
jgi:hypothetical protein